MLCAFRALLSLAVTSFWLIMAKWLSEVASGSTTAFSAVVDISIAADFASEVFCAAIWAMRVLIGIQVTNCCRAVAATAASSAPLKGNDRYCSKADQAAARAFCALTAHLKVRRPALLCLSIWNQMLRWFQSRYLMRLEHNNLL